MGKKLAFWGDCNGYGYKIIRILEELRGINVLNYCGTEITSLYYIDEKNHILFNFFKMIEYRDTRNKNI